MSLKYNAHITLMALSLAGMGLAAAQPAVAATNLVQNFSFEKPATTTTTVNQITNWTGSLGSSYGNFNPSSKPGAFTAPVPSGVQVAYVNTGDIFQNITVGTSATPVKLTAGHTYTLSAYLGIRNDMGFTTSNTPTGNISLETTNGTFLVGGSGLFAKPGTYKQFQFTLTPTSSSTFLGSSLRVALGIDNPGSNRQVEFDNVRLFDTMASPAPEPAEVATLSLIGLGIGSLLLRARKRKAGLMVV